MGSHCCCRCICSQADEATALPQCWCGRPKGTWCMCWLLWCQLLWPHMRPEAGRDMNVLPLTGNFESSGEAAACQTRVPRYSAAYLCPLESAALSALTAEGSILRRLWGSKSWACRCAAGARKTAPFKNMSEWIST